jgi:uncharacterized metal-binding protein YceD (DUF177 family)
MSGSFTIPVSTLKEGLHCFDFEIDKGFFEQFEESEIKEGKLKAAVKAEKRSTIAELTIVIEGVVNIMCDRCLGILSYPVNCENHLVIKSGRVHDESDPDIITLMAEEHEFDLKQYFYEYISLSLPIQKVHPDDENGNSTCDPEMLKKIREHMVNEEDRSDPRWEELKNLVKN